VEESGSKIIDEIYRDAYKGVGKLAFSYWNIAEAAVVLDKYERKLVLKHHIYVADALQLASAKSIDNCMFVTGDRELTKVAEAEGLSIVYTS